MPVPRDRPFARPTPSEFAKPRLGLWLAADQLRSIMNRPLWKEALLPTLLLGGLWPAFGLATTAYIAWLDQGHQRVVDENVASIHAAGEVQGVLWSLQDSVAEATESEFSEADSTRIGVGIARLEAALKLASESARTDAEQHEVAELRRSFADYRDLLDRSKRGESLNVGGMFQVRNRSRDLAKEMSDRCTRLRELNQQLIRTDAATRETWNQLIGGIRLILLFAGPILGVWLGIRAASKVRRRLTEISVRLEGMSGEYGRLEVTTSPNGGEFDELDRQVLAITQRLDGVLKQLQSARREVRRSERLAAVGQLAAGVAHELRNPLTAVKLLVQTVARDHRDDATTAKQLGVVQDEVVRMERTIQSLLDYARPPAQNRLRHDLRDTIGRALNLMQGRAERDRVRIELSLPAESLIADGDPEQLHQVFVNLLLNGMDAMPNGGQIAVTLQRGELLAPGDQSPRPASVVTVADSGAGIPESIIEHLFEPFVTSKERGTGLGLAISRRIIEEHQGTLTAANNPHGGAVFLVKLPLVTQLDSWMATSGRLRELETAEGGQPVSRV